MQYLDLENGGTNDIFIDGAFMASDKLKIKYELHYWETDGTGVSQSSWESLVIKAIYFPSEGAWGDIKYRTAVGLDWVLDLGDQTPGIGVGADHIAPFGGIALTLPTKTTLIPLVQHYMSYSGNNVKTTGLRLIALQPLPNQTWLKLDVISPFDWAEDGTIRGAGEIQYGVNLNESLALYTDGLVGFGGGKLFDWGLGLGLRFKY